MELDHSCASCSSYDGDGYCALPRKDRKLAGYIQEPESVVCVRWEKRLSELDLTDKDAADRERHLYREEKY